VSVTEAGTTAADVLDPGAGEQREFAVRVAGFEGPFDLLLSLIAKHRIEVTELALHTVTDDFIAHVRGQGPEWDLDEATSFLVIAATLLDLKAARLLPDGSVEDEEDLALLEARDLLFARLLQYRAFKEVAGLLDGMVSEAATRRPRDVGLEPWLAELLPEVLLGLGPTEFAAIAESAFAPKEPEPGVSVEHVHAPAVSVREQAAVLVERLRRRGQSTFRALTDDAPSTLVVVGRFLALLELYRDGVVSFEQAAALGDLTVRWTGSEDGADADAIASRAVTDEFSGAPVAGSAEAGTAAPAAAGSAATEDEAAARGAATEDQAAARGAAGIDEEAR
jgi:segregation and condensation protein A